MLIAAFCSCVGVIQSDGCCFFQAEDGIRDLGRSRGLGDVYKRQVMGAAGAAVGGTAVGTAVAGTSVALGSVTAAALVLSLIHI